VPVVLTSSGDDTVEPIFYIVIYCINIINIINIINYYKLL